MKKISFITGRNHYRNSPFIEKKSGIEIGSKSKYIALRDLFWKRGYNLSTSDINSPEESEYNIYFDMPAEKLSQIDPKKSFLLAIESSIICPENFEKDKHQNFKKVFCWNDNLVDGKKYFKINYAFDLPVRIPKKTDKKKLCCLIVSNKSSNATNELYSERRSLVRWFEYNYPNDFDLYGVGWNEFRFKGPKFIRALNRLPLLNKIIYSLVGEVFSSYKGIVNNKYQIMQEYKFAICYENVEGEKGYITEKLFDAMFAGCIPVYLGASNITDYIPSNAFIDRRNYSSNEELHSYLANMSIKDYSKFLINIESFLQSDSALQFSSAMFAETIVNEVLND
jgi:hypothetical protein